MIKHARIYSGWLAVTVAVVLALASAQAPAGDDMTRTVVFGVS